MIMTMIERKECRHGLSRRESIRLALGSAAALFCGCGAEAEPTGSTMKNVGATAMLQRAVPRSGEKIPVIGMGTWQTFDVGSSESERKPLVEVLRLFIEGGGRVIDSSPMYGRSESVAGELRRQVPGGDSLFLGTKVWTTGRDAGIAEMKQSMDRMKTRRMDLMQIHNLVDWRTHLPTLREWKERGTIRYLGITHYTRGSFNELATIMKKEKVDFVQLPFSIALRDAEETLLAVAQETQTAVIVNRPFEGGSLFSEVRSRALPEFAKEFDCQSWGQFFLKYIVSHPGVTCVIPATSNPRHIVDNLGAGRGRMPDAETRRRMVREIG